MKLVIEPAELPPGVINVVTGYGAVVGEPLVTHPKVAKVAFTGGTATGARVNELAAKTFKKVSLELGGKSPNIVFDDCILDDAVSGAVSGIFAATGPDLHRRLAPAAAGDASTTSSWRSWSPWPSTARLGDPAQARDPGRPGDDAAAVPEDPLLHRHRQGRRRQVRAGRRSGDARRRAAASISSSRPSSPASTTRCASPRRRCSGRCCPSSSSRTRRRRSRSPTTSPTGSAPACGRSRSSAPPPWPSASGPARCGSTPIAP